MQTEVLRDELAHRLKNLMTMVQAIAHRTLKHLEPKEAVAAFDRRLVAMAGAQQLLIQQGFGPAPLHNVIDALLAMHGDRFDVEGPEIELGSKAVLALSLVLHELATNASKYGALATADGRIELRWQVQPRTRGDELVLCWRERGGPPVTPPEGTGFGSKLIDMGLGGKCKVDRRYPPDGAEVEMRAPVRDLGML